MVYVFLIFRGWKAVSIHGDKAQSERTKALSLFKKGSCPLMVCCSIEVMFYLNTVFIKIQWRMLINLTLWHYVFFCFALPFLSNNWMDIIAHKITLRVSTT